MDSDYLLVGEDQLAHVVIMIAQFNRGLITLEELCREMSLYLKQVILFRWCKEIGMTPLFRGNGGIRLKIHYEV